MNQPQYMPPPKLRLSNWRLAVFFCRFAAYRFNGGRFGPLAAKRFYARTTK